MKDGAAGGDRRAPAGALASVTARGIALVAVPMADQQPNLGLVTVLAAAGFRGDARIRAT
jgi:hypothetical protein